MKALDEVKIQFDHQYFKQLMKEKKWKHKRLAEETGLYLLTIRNYSKGARLPKTEALYKIAIALDVSMEDLLKEV